MHAPSSLGEGLRFRHDVEHGIQGGQEAGLRFTSAWIHGEVWKAALSEGLQPLQLDRLSGMASILSFRCLQPTAKGLAESDVTSIATQLSVDRGDLGSIAEVAEDEVAFTAFAAFALAAFFELLGAARSSAASSSSAENCQSAIPAPHKPTPRHRAAPVHLEEDGEEPGPAEVSDESPENFGVCLYCS